MSRAIDRTEAGILMGQAINGAVALLRSDSEVPEPADVATYASALFAELLPLVESVIEDRAEKPGFQRAPKGSSGSSGGKWSGTQTKPRPSGGGSNWSGGSGGGGNREITPKQMSYLGTLLAEREHDYGDLDVSSLSSEEASNMIAELKACPSLDVF
jgi:hypothetical protein